MVFLLSLLLFILVFFFRNIVFFLSLSLFILILLAFMSIMNTNSNIFLLLKFYSFLFNVQSILDFSSNWAYIPYSFLSIAFKMVKPSIKVDDDELKTRKRVSQLYKLILGNLEYNKATKEDILLIRELTLILINLTNSPPSLIKSSIIL
jgi:hypothetical protein